MARDFKLGGGTVILGWSGGGGKTGVSTSRVGMRWSGSAGGDTFSVGSERCSSAIFIDSCAYGG